MKKVAHFILVVVVTLLAVTASHALTAAEEKKLSNGLDQHLWSRASANMEFVRAFVDRKLAKDEELMFRNSIRNIVEVLTLLENGELKKVSADNICMNNMDKVSLSAVEKDWLSTDDLVQMGTDFKDATVQENIKNILAQFNKALCQQD